MLPTGMKQGKHYSVVPIDENDTSWYNVFEYLKDLPERTRGEKEIAIMQEIQDAPYERFYCLSMPWI